MYATAGSRKKREYLKSLGVEHVMDSRSLEFANRILELTGGRGVDLVLNSLTGKALTRSVEGLGNYGRFVELGKTDIYRNNRMGLKPFRKNLSYHAVDIDKLLVERLELCAAMLKEIMALFQNKRISPHPFRVFPASKISDAFRLMAQAKHIGKIVVTMKEQGLMVKPSRDIRSIVGADRTYLITGGCSGFGLAAGQWLASAGARHLVLMSRGGAKTDREKKIIAEMKKSGVKVAVTKADVTSEEQVAKVLKDIDKTMPPLGGIIHAAMVIEDAVAENVDHEKLMRVVRPKAFGAWILHSLTQDRNLDFFIMFSSIASIYGSAGQTNYAAANAFLDAFSHYRRSKGLAGTTVNWGVIGEVGYAARNVKVNATLARQGWKSFSIKRATRILEEVLLLKPEQIIALDADWKKVVDYYPAFASSQRFSHLFAEKGEKEQEQIKKSESLRTILQAEGPDKQNELLKTHVRDQIARILGVSSAKLDVRDSLSSMGFDSLMVNQLRNWIRQKLDVEVSMMEIMRGPSIEELTGNLLKSMKSEKTPVEAEIPEELSVEQARQLLDNIDQLSDDQIERLLSTISAEEG
jgi:NADPH:quinone reductase-like Zn-dependent oxidoreductase/aryl carrier-like protein